MADWRERAEAVRREQEAAQKAQRLSADQQTRERSANLRSALDRLVKDLKADDLLRQFNSQIWLGSGGIVVGSVISADLSAEQPILLSRKHTRESSHYETVYDRKFGRYKTYPYGYTALDGSYSEGDPVTKIGFYDVPRTVRIPYTRELTEIIGVYLKSFFGSTDQHLYLVDYRDYDSRNQADPNRPLPNMEGFLQRLKGNPKFARAVNSGFEPSIMGGSSSALLRVKVDSYDPDYTRGFLEECLLESTLART